MFIAYFNMEEDIFKWFRIAEWGGWKLKIDLFALKGVEFNGLRN